MVVWVQDPGGGAKRRIVKRTYLLNGSTVEDSPVALSNSPNNATCSATASNADGRSMVVWDESPPTGAEIHYNVIEPTGEIWPHGDQLLTGSAVGVFNGCPAVAATGTGEFCILWHGADNNEHVDCFDPTGAHAGTSQVLTGALSSGSSRQWGARAIWGVNGGFVGSWFEAAAQPDQSHFLVGTQLDATGLVIGNAITFSQLFYDYDGNGFALGTTGAFVTSYAMRGQFGASETKTRFLMSRYDSYTQPAVQQDQLVSDTHTDEFGGRLIGHSSGLRRGLVRISRSCDQRVRFALSQVRPGWRCRRRRGFTGVERGHRVRRSARGRCHRSRRRHDGLDVAQRHNDRLSQPAGHHHPAHAGAVTACARSFAPGRRRARRRCWHAVGGPLPGAATAAGRSGNPSRPDCST